MDLLQEAARSAVRQELVTTANSQYAGYVKDQTDQLLTGTKQFVEAHKSGDDARARALYPKVREHWERIEPGQEWTGWHRLEKDLWWPKDERPAALLNKTQRTTYADRLMSDTVKLHRRVLKMTFTADQIGDGAKSLLDEVATGKVTGEEEAWSHTDLYDFHADIDDARIAFEGLQPVLRKKDPALEKTLTTRFANIQKLLDKYRTGKDGFVSYDRLGCTSPR